MDIFRRHEIFEIEVLDRLNSARLLEPLVFGGGTMLRLCHELNRFSVDLDFWFVKELPQEKFLYRMRDTLAQDYEITDVSKKHFTLLLGIRSGQYPKRLKIEIRRENRTCDFQQSIAFSVSSTRQVPVRAHTLKQSMINKVEAFLDRGEIRDCFDIEFLIRRGVELPESAGRLATELSRRIAAFKDVDFKVKLGSILEKEYRDYYITNRFTFLEGRLASLRNRCSP